MLLNGFLQGAWISGIVNHLWQSTLVMAVAWLLTLVLRRNQARTRYRLWMAASLKLLMPFSLLTSIGHWLRPTAATQMTYPLFAHAVEKVGAPVAQVWPGTPYAGQLISQRPAVSPALHQGRLPEIVLILWMCGVLFLLLRWLRGWWEIKTVLQSSRLVSLPIDIPAFLTSRMIEPGIVGIVRPVLLMPETLLERLSPLQLQSILAHESCHVCRRDNLTAAMHMVVEALFWFHPAVWWIERRLIEERERACDEAVLLLGNEAETYAESILGVCKAYAESPIVCMSGVTGSELKQRILRIMMRQETRELSFARKFLLSAVAIGAVSLPVMFGLLDVAHVHAQSRPTTPSEGIASTWQGTLHTDREYRFVVKITRVASGPLKAIFYNLDGPPGGMPAVSTTLTDSSFKLDFAFATYEGRLSGDGGSITGTWKQGPTAQPLLFTRATQETEWTIPQPPPRLAPMAKDADPSFEVATIRVSAPEEHGPRYMFEPHRFSVTHVSLSQLVQFAYGLQQREIAGEPDWFNTEAYSISARPDAEGEPSIKQWQAMVRKLMTERFQLKFHDEKRELTVYALTIAKNGPKLTKSQGDPNGTPGLGFGPPGNMGATNATMADIAEAMQQGAVDRPVVDQTGLTGRYDLRLRWTPSDLQAATQDGDTAPDLFTAIQEQLGLKLETTRAPVNIKVIDGASRPSAN